MVFISIEVPVNEDIREYEPKDIGSFTIRQIISLILCIAVEAIIIILTHKVLGQAIIIPMLILGIPIIAQGFWKPLGFSFNEYIYIKFNNSFQLNARIYRNHNSLAELEEACIKYDLEENKKRKRRKKE
ncbi:PrgI family protein [Intestinibacter sp.]|uniref:PrgI family protein n=1 Tax=Intestinibacter sp. TaxID=1965304 RepID=UPI003F14C607